MPVCYCAELELFRKDVDDVVAKARAAANADPSGAEKATAAAIRTLNTMAAAEIASARGKASAMAQAVAEARKEILIVALLFPKVEEADAKAAAAGAEAAEAEEAAEPVAEAEAEEAAEPIAEAEPPNKRLRCNVVESSQTDDIE